MKDLLREKNYLPILFDFTRPAGKNMIETVNTLARLSKFVIVDLTDSRDARREIEAVTKIDTLPVSPVVHKEDAENEYSWFRDYLHKETVLFPFEYDHDDDIVNFFGEKILPPAEEKYEELRRKRLEIELRLSKERKK